MRKLPHNLPVVPTIPDRHIVRKVAEILAISYTLRQLSEIEKFSAESNGVAIMRLKPPLTLSSDRRGTATLEYALLGAVVASAVLIATAGLGGSMGGALGQLSGATEGLTVTARSLD